MKIKATLTNRFQQHQIQLQTNEDVKTLQLPSKASGYGSAFNGGELLLLALATCYCNDLYREAAKRSLTLEEVEVLVTADFGAEGEPGSDFQYHARVSSSASAEEIEDLLQHTDRVAEIHNTLRRGVSITLTT
ncbi:OsmC family protein [Tellurirhabdus rosea]|uniref:OsmC family protein n=1 Tax=Tellurirhabdus rosea TaxID=2674997 RepID=UPI00225535C7|nr:OsmC family protein [Tellurirhabdus rosea]